MAELWLLGLGLLAAALALWAAPREAWAPHWSWPKAKARGPELP